MHDWVSDVKYSAVYLLKKKYKSIIEKNKQLRLFSVNSAINRPGLITGPSKSKQIWTKLNICSSEARACLHLSHVGSISGLIAASLTVVQHINKA